MFIVAEHQRNLVQRANQALLVKSIPHDLAHESYPLAIALGPSLRHTRPATLQVTERTRQDCTNDGTCKGGY